MPQTEPMTPEAFALKSIPLNKEKNVIQKAAFFKNLCYEAASSYDYSFATVQVIVKHVDGVVYIVFRATDTDADWKVHFSEFSAERNHFFDIVDPRIRVHGGWSADYVGIRKYILNEVSFFLEKGFCEFCVVGHSYGGALASACALDLTAYFGISVSIVTFGAPRMGNKHFVNALMERVVSEHHFVYGNDGVPLLPPAFVGYRKYNNTEYLGTRDWRITLKNTIVTGFKWLKAILKKQSFDYFQFVVAYDHLLERIDNDIDIEL